MQQNDKKPFADALAATFAVYGQTITPDVMRIWWNVLDGYRLDAVLSALSYHVGDHEGHGYRLPTPADVRKHLETTLPRLAADEARPFLDAHRARIAKVNEQIMRLRADVQLGLLDHTVAVTQMNVLAASLRDLQDDLAYRKALAGPAIRDEPEDQPPPRNWIPPFLRRGIAMLTGGKPT
jgi:hypothetical protein